MFSVSRREEGERATVIGARIVAAKNAGADSRPFLFRGWHGACSVGLGAEGVCMTSLAKLEHSKKRAGQLALVVGVLLFAGKFSAYALTGSTALFADAMESTVNIIAAGMMVIALALAARPPDEHHPYGHGKVEFFSAGIEGAAIAAAALMILAEGIRDLVQGPALQRLGLGMGILAGCTVANAALGAFLTREGRRTRSMALAADGRHVLTDVWTSAGVIGGLLVVHLTGWVWADPLIAIAVAINVVREGVALLREAYAGLMDHADPETLEFAAEVLRTERRDSWIDVHGLRSWSSGARRHFDLHLTVPRFFDVEHLHRIHDRVETKLFQGDLQGGDVVVHFDPCEVDHCARCSMADCSIREAPFREALPMVREHITRSDELAFVFPAFQGSVAGSKSEEA
ncbi:MAG: cation transporter [Deltaproteobacteria bacterium]|nr:cation transporter [Deltaproteobacteria bacterium]